MSQSLASQADISPSGHGLWVLDAQAIIRGPNTVKNEKGAPEVWARPWGRDACRQLPLCVRPWKA